MFFSNFLKATYTDLIFSGKFVRNLERKYIIVLKVLVH